MDGQRFFGFSKLQNLIECECSNAFPNGLALSPSRNRQRKAGIKTTCRNSNKSQKSWVVDPFGLLCLKSSFCLSLSAVFFCFKTKQPIHKTPRIINGFCFCDSSPIEMTPKMATWKFRKFRNRKPCVTQHSWLSCKGTQQKYTKLAWLFKGPPGLGLYMWPDGVMMSVMSVMSTSCYMSK